MGEKGKVAIRNIRREANEEIKKLLKDKHANVIAHAIKIAGLLARGLRDRFAQEAKILTTPILLKLKDKNKAIEREAKAALTHFFSSYELGKVLESYLEMLKEKAPKIRINVMGMMEGYFLVKAGERAVLEKVVRKVGKKRPWRETRSSMTKT